MRHTAHAAKHCFIRAAELPGPMSMSRLVRLGIVKALDSGCGFLSAHADTLYGRASIAGHIVPYGAVACATLAAWVWIGGEFPATVDIISDSHFRSRVFGRPIHVYNRCIPPEHLRRLADLQVTSPMRTVCDLACLGFDNPAAPDACADVRTLLHQHRLRPSECLNMLCENIRWPGHAQGVQLLEALRQAYEERSPKQAAADRKSVTAAV